MGIERVLSKHGIEYKPVGSSFLIRCIEPDHEDKNPSMLVNKYSGLSTCMSCGFKANLFEFFGETPDWLNIQKEKLRQKLNKVASQTSYLEFPESAVFHKSSYRGISAETMQKFQAFQCSEFPGYICFPIKNAAGKIINFIGRDTSNTRTKYIISHKREIDMYPKNNDRLGSVIFVEGMFDMINLYDKGIENARCIFGTSLFKREYIDSLKVEGIDEVVLMMDGDQAGKDAAVRLEEMFDETPIKTRKVKLPDGKDPGNLTKDYISRIRTALYEPKDSNS